jgi:hypothetical protein
LRRAPSKTYLCTGHIVREDARSAAGALAAVEWGTAPTPEIAIRANENGIFRLALPNGRFRVEARAPDGAIGSIELMIENAPREFEIVLKRG